MPLVCPPWFTEYSMILVDLNGKDLLRELMSAYVGNDAIAQACKSALDCIESAESLSKARGRDVSVPVAPCQRAQLFTPMALYRDFYMGPDSARCLLLDCQLSSDRKKVERAVDPIVKFRHMLAAGQVMSVSPAILFYPLPRLRFFICLLPTADGVVVTVRCGSKARP
jgi:hypothetical protein